LPGLAEIYRFISNGDLSNYQYNMRLIRIAKGDLDKFGEYHYKDSFGGQGH
jgi:hypothetical protein